MAGKGSSGAWARGGAIVSAALASMCCILPLGLGALGLSSAVVAAFFELLRPWFLALAAFLLCVGFYFALRRPAEQETCNTDSRWLSKLSKPALLDVPGVIDAAVSDHQKNAQVRARSARPPEAFALLTAAEKAGYSAALDPE